RLEEEDKEKKVAELLIDPSDLICPITLVLMNEPVMASDGFSYEEHAIGTYFKNPHPGPIKGVPFKNKDLIGNKNLKSQIESYKSDTTKECLELVEWFLHQHDYKTSKKLLDRIEELSPRHPSLTQLKTDLYTGLKQPDLLL